LPPFYYFRSKRVSSLQAAQLNRRGKAGRKIDVHAIRAKDVSDSCGLAQVFRAQALRAGVDIIQNGPINSDRRIGARVIAQAWGYLFRQHIPVPQRPARIAPLDATVEVIPVIEHAQPQPWFLTDIQIFERLKSLHQTQEVKSAIERANLAV